MRVISATPVIAANRSEPARSQHRVLGAKKVDVNRPGYVSPSLIGYSAENFDLPHGVSLIKKDGTQIRMALSQGHAINRMVVTHLVRGMEPTIINAKHTGKQSAPNQTQIMPPARSAGEKPPGPKTVKLKETLGGTENVDVSGLEVDVPAIVHFSAMTAGRAAERLRLHHDNPIYAITSVGATALKPLHEDSLPGLKFRLGRDGTLILSRKGWGQGQNYDYQILDTHAGDLLAPGRVSRSRSLRLSDKSPKLLKLGVESQAQRMVLFLPHQHCLFDVPAEAEQLLVNACINAERLPEGFTL